jgi:hypothetical protein
MNKEIIKNRLRESLFPNVKEEQTADSSKQASDNKKTSETDNKHEKDYGELERKLDGTMLKASQVMAAAGLGSPKNATDRSLFSKKVRREKNDEGGLYQFSQEDLSSIMKVINNPASYLNIKSKK